MITAQEIENLMNEIDKVLAQHQDDKLDNLKVYMKLADVRGDLYGIYSDMESEDWNKSNPIQNA